MRAASRVSSILLFAATLLFAGVLSAQPALDGAGGDALASNPRPGDSQRPASADSIGDPQPAVSAATQANPDWNTLLMRCTFKIEGDGAQRIVYGTAFVLRDPIPGDPTGFRNVLVTARHVLASMVGNDAILYMRAAGPAGSEMKIRHHVPIRRDGQPLWVGHPDPNVDVAALVIPLPLDADVPIVTTDALATDDALATFGIHPGDELFCLGYPYGTEANEAGYPILRSGKISSYPIVPTSRYGSFLYDFAVYPGNSGGPAYFVQSDRALPDGTRSTQPIAFIAGVVVGERVKIEDAKTSGESEAVSTLGLARVVPSTFVRETIRRLLLGRGELR
ncbi:MAG: serine protease [Candidatus Eisenbacteria bacterium]|nr:serine protease [Candidatus Eisenbacteria bacterium]